MLQTIQTKLLESCKKFADNVAIEYGWNSITYQELDRRSDLIVGFLGSKGIKDGILIGVFIDNKIDFICTLMGILKAKCIFVPIDTNYPEKRLESMLAENDIGLIFTDENNHHKISNIVANNAGKEEIALLNDSLFTEPVLFSEGPELEYNLEDSIYQYFTSGSTGNPKAVIGINKSLAHFVDWEIETFNLDHTFRVSQLTSISFDASLRDIFVTLCCGGTICIPLSRDAILDSPSLINWIEQTGVNLIHCTPSLFKLINSRLLNTENFKQLKYILLAGEKINPAELEKWFDTFGERIQLVNLYGSTETTMIKLFHLILREDTKRKSIPIGKPMRGCRVIILDKNMEICNQGVVGEIYIRTPYRTKGYCNNPELTCEKFMVNPFNNDPNDLIYRTGDLGRLLPDGIYEFIGRNDRQVKIRGNRIEISEIENTLLSCPMLKEAAVIDKENTVTGDQYLCAYLVADEISMTGEVTNESWLKDIREFLREKLPEYMIPNYFVRLEKMPVTANGKLDYQALPEPNENINKEYIAPRDEVELKLVGIWSKILRVDNVSIKENFLQIGGHSLNAIALVAKVHQEFNVELPLEQIFNNGTVEELAVYIKNAEKSMSPSIKPAAKKEYYAVSSMQKRLFILDQFDDVKTTYNLPEALLVEGYLNYEKVRQVFEILIQRHETFRTSFEFIAGEPVQRIHQQVDFKIDFIDMSGNIEEDKGQETKIKEIIKSFIRSFDLGKAPLLRVSIIKLTENKHILVYDIHHIITDGTSMFIFARDFSNLYHGLELPELPIQYKDFSEWQNELLKSDRVQQQEAYWLEKFDDDIPILNLPTDYPRPSVKSFEGDNYIFEIEDELTRKINKLAFESSVTLYMVLLAAYNVILLKYTGQEDIVIGSPVAGRSHIDLENVMGMFVNTLAMRNKPLKNLTFMEFLNEVKENSLRAYENQDYQFEELVDKLDLPRDLSRNPLFETLLVLQNMDQQVNEFRELRFSSYYYENKLTKFDLTLIGTEANGSIYFNLEYCSKLFKPETIQRFAGHFVSLLTEVTENPDKKLFAIEVLSENEKNRILVEFNDTKAEYPQYKLIHEIFEEQAKKTPDTIAISYQGIQLTYKALNEKSNQVANHLKSKGINENSIIGIITPHTLETIIGIIGILKTGGAYLPIDPGYPKERIKYMLSDSRTEILLTQSDLDEEFGDELLIINLHNEELSRNNDCSNPRSKATIRPPAYIIYTSGSTGKPKGVMVEHQNVIRLVKNTNYINFTAGDRILQTGPIVFDASTFEIWGSLLNGLSLYLVDNDVILDAQKLEEALNEYQITTLWLTSPLFNQLSQQKPDLFKMVKNLLVGGDVLSPKDINRVRQCCKETKIINGYGPTENTTFSTSFMIDQDYDNNIPIGKPISNSTAYILDMNTSLTPIGVTGELYVGGDGVARGYLNNPELTAQMFISNPFIAGERLYRTGDLAQWQIDGDIKFLGRLDHQVKIRGYRIELGEIETHLSKHPQVQEAVVLVKVDTTRNKYLCAYLIAKENLTIPDIREYLLNQLAEYMIPNYFVQLEKFPLTPNGKIDLKALPEPESYINSGMAYVAPGNEIEEKLVSIWQEILGVTQIGVLDDFFELGGHSLKAMALVNMVYKLLNVNISLREIFNRPTIRELAQYIMEAETSIYAAIKLAEEKEYYPLSPAQKRLFILDQFEGISTSYNIPGVMLLEGELDRIRLETVFETLIKRHESLRTSFILIEGEPVQRIHRDVDFEISYRELEEIGARGEDIAINNIIREFIRPFDLQKAPLLRAGLVKLSEHKHVFMFDMHHIITDGVSMGILSREFINLYNQVELPELRIQYKDFSEWQNELFLNGVIKKQEKYWLEQFSARAGARGEIPVLDLPTDYPRPSIQSFEGTAFGFEIEAELARQLYHLQAETDATLYMILLAIYDILLAKYTGKDDIVVGSPISGRHHADMENIIGIFVNTLALRNHPSGGKTFREFIDEVKENALRAYENQDYQFEELLEQLNLRRDLSRNPLFDTMLVLQNLDQEALEIANLKFIPYGFDIKVVKFDLTLNVQEAGGRIWITFEYSTKLFKEETVRRLAGHFINILSQVVENPAQRLAEIAMIPEKEKRQILLEFNDTKAKYPKEKTIHALFEEQVEKTPEDIAVLFEDKHLTYRELNIRANKLAGLLREKGVGSNQIVGIMLERSLEMIIGIFGILKAGGAYLPIDPGYPAERINFILEDSGAELIVTGRDLADRAGLKGQIVDPDDERVYAHKLSQFSGVNPENNSKPGDLAYVIYTSGSTGRPKGTMIEHYSVINRLYWMQKRYPLDIDDVILQKTTYTFDVSVWELFWWALSGSKVCFLKPGGEKDPEMIVGAIAKNNVTVIHFVPAMLAAFLEYLKTQTGMEKDSARLSSLRRVFASGEALNVKQVQDFNQLLYQGLGVKLTNLYGPTEATVDVSYFDCWEEEEPEKIPIGKPIDNIGLYLFNKDNQLQPVGIPGELCITGDGLARGYLNRPELTAEKFVPNPLGPRAPQGTPLLSSDVLFQTSNFTLHNSKMYRTGDLARWLPDGNIEFLGRIDHQVKIRGFRIELGEIEACLLEHEMIQEAVVAVKEDTFGGKELCAYLVGTEALAIPELRAYLGDKLPDYMIPSYFMQLEKMPLTSNGKIDRKALPEPEKNLNLGLTYIEPENDTEEKLALIWQEVLGVGKVGVVDNFFELGGHSLKAMALLNRIYKELNVSILLREIFKRPTIRELAQYIKDAEKSIFRAIEPAATQEHYALSSTQKRLFILDQIGNPGLSYNMSISVYVEGDFAKERVEKALQELIKRHEALRTSFVLFNGEPVQRVHQNVDFKVNYIELDQQSISEDETKFNQNVSKLVKEFIRPFDLSAAPLLRAQIIKLKEDYHVFTFDMHHIISDGESLSIIVQEFNKLYQGENLPELRIQYKDFSEWQNELFKTDFFKKQEEYWINQFAGTIPELNMSTDYPRAVTRSFVGETVNFELDRESYSVLKHLLNEYQVTLSMFLVAIYNIVLSKYTGKEDIAIGMPIAGRVHEDLKNVVGLFLNTIALRCHPKGELSFKAFLEEVKENSLKAYENQEYPFERLIEQLKIRNDINRNPLFDTMFIMQNVSMSTEEIDTLQFKPFNMDFCYVKFDFKLEAIEGNEQIFFTIDYCKDLFMRETMERLSRRFISILKEVLADPLIQLSEIESKEKAKVISDYYNDINIE